MWHKYGKLHRENGPAVIEKWILLHRTTKTWYKNGKRHRDGDLPAETINHQGNVSKKWFINGKLHRDDGPAVINFHGTQTWYKNGVKGKIKPVFVKRNTQNAS